MRNVALSAASLLVLLGASSVPGVDSASANATPRATESGTWQHDEALRETAAEQGVSIEHLEAQLPLQSEFAVLAGELEEKFPEDFSNARVLKDLSFEISFAREIPNEAKVMIKSSGLTVTVVENVGWTNVQLETLTERFHYAVYDLLGDGVVTSPDPSTRAITVLVPPGSEDAARAAITRIQTTVELPDGWGLTVAPEEVDAHGEDAVYGGASLTSCTSGFSVFNSLYPNALITAAHCSNTQTYTGGISLSFRAESTTRDVQWHSVSGHTAQNAFYYQPGTLEFVTGKANPVVGQTLCKNGKTTGRTCDVTYVDNQCRGAYCDMMTMTNRKANSGDSGGPWHSGPTAYGVHSGYINLNGAPRDMFTPINSGLSALSLGLK